ncbi:MAG: 50S ribosomal protein L13 [Deltaproteobacteria bacterium]|nr:50S ribosomal protein L13 [Deltaproteobacteria bacterium]
MTKAESLAQRRWYVIDAEGQVLGRMATEIARVLRGKHKPSFSPHVDGGDFVIVVNAKRVKLTGSKETDKRYYRHSGYPGGLRVRSLSEMREKKPEAVVRLAVKGMLPKNRLGKGQLGKLKVYAGPEHPHQAQLPMPLTI